MLDRNMTCNVPDEALKITESRGCSKDATSSYLTGPTKVTDKPGTQSSLTRPLTHIKRDASINAYLEHGSTRPVQRTAHGMRPGLDKIREGLATQDMPRRPRIVPMSKQTLKIHGNSRPSIQLRYREQELSRKSLRADMSMPKPAIGLPSKPPVFSQYGKPNGRAESCSSPMRKTGSTFHRT